MPENHSDRNLLIGILALQMDFIDSDQLIGAMREWVDDKSKPLDGLLEAQGFIDEQTRKLLVALVDRHIQLHENQVDKSIASIGLASRVCNMLGKLEDDDVNKTLKFVSGTKDGHPAVDKTVTLDYLSRPDSAGMRFRIVRPHDQGGIGTVSVAVDNELHREVALKEIQQQFASNEEARERFTLEAEITGGLEHPGIVPVYGFGHYDDGRPFYAMRFIRGDNMQQAIRRHYQRDLLSDDDPNRTRMEKPVEFRRLLGQLVDVCHAIHYAHCRGVLHRDLKPGNIMLGKYGETLVVDWGLAKTSLHPESAPLTSEAPLNPVYSSGTEQTQQGTHLGTPSYMSPEQAAGRLDLIDSRSDVYSLGVTLYEILTGKRAFNEKSVTSVLAKVRRGEFLPPRKANSDTPAPLNAICLKAMATDPNDRYATALDMARDLEHWLADEPVSAWIEPPSARLRRWVKRHRTFVTSLVTAGLAAMAILTAAVGLLNAAKNRETNQRQRAESNLAVAMQAVDVMLTEVASEELEDVPQMEQVRGQLLGKARDFYEQFRNQRPGDPAMRSEVAQANKRLGDIFRLMGEVEPSKEAYQTSIEMLSALHDDFPDQPQFQQHLANTKNYLGVLYKKFDRERALDTYNETVELQNNLVERFPGNPHYRQELARSHYNRGILLTTDAGAVERAESDFRAAMKHLTQLLDESPPEADIPGCRQELARCHSNLAILQRSGGELVAARRNYEQAIAGAEALVAEYPRTRVYKSELALYYNNLSNLLLAMPDADGLDAAQRANRKAIAIYESLAAAVPKVRSDLGNIHHSRGAIMSKRNQSDEAAEEFLLAVDTFEPLVEQYPKFPHYADRLGNAHYELAKIHYAKADELIAGEDDQQESINAKAEFQRAQELVDQAIELHGKIVEAYPQDKSYREHLGSDLFLKGWILKKLIAMNLEGVPRTQLLEVGEALRLNSPEKESYQQLADELMAKSRDAPD